MYLSQQHSSESIPYVTAKHNKHDSFWLLPGVTSPLFCFGCAIENVEDSKVLNYQKKHILTDLLDILLHNKTIWQLFANKSDVHQHVVALLLKLLIDSNDSDLRELCSELCLLITKRTTPEKTATIVIDQFMLKVKSFGNTSFLCFLKELISVVPTIVVTICDNKALFVVELLNFISTCKSEFQMPAWSLLTSCLRAVVAEEILLTQNLLKQILKTMTEANVTSMTVDIEILKCLQSFIRIGKALQLLLQHECSNLTVPTSSVLEHIKKMLLCSSEEGKKIAISCLTDIAKKDVDNLSAGQETEFSSLLNLILQRGLTEYLLELLSSSNNSVIYELFQCLEILSYSKRFHSLGHMVYGFSSVIKAVHNTDNVSCCIKGLLLIDIILKGRSLPTAGGDTNKTNITETQITELFNLVKKCFIESFDEKIKSSSTNCLCSFLRSSKSISSTNYEKIASVLELMFVFIERDITSSVNSQMKPCHIELVENTYESVLLFVVHISSNSNSEDVVNTQQSSISTGDPPTTNNNNNNNINNSQDDRTQKTIDQLFFLCDRYFIAQASLKFLPRRDVQFQVIFYQMVLAIIELDVTKGEQMARKMSESTFITKIYEFKVIAARVNTKTQVDISNVLGKLLVYLCMSVDCSNKHSLFDEAVMETFIQFSIPIQEWKLCFGDHRHQQQQMSTSNYATTRWTVMLALLACTHKAGRILIPLATLQTFMEQLAQDPTSLLSISVLGKRFYVYLCCQLDMLQNPGSMKPNPIYHKLCSQILASNMEKQQHLLFHHSNSFLIWLLRLNVPNNVFQSFIELFFTSISGIDSLAIALQQSNCAFVFVERTIKILSALTNNALQLISSFLEAILAGIEEERHGYLKHLIHKSLMFTEEFNHGIITVYTRLLNTICIKATRGRRNNLIVSEDDLKLFCRILTYIRTDAVPTLLIEALKFCYLILSISIRAQDVKPISIAMKNDSLLGTFSKLFFNNEKMLASASSSKTSLMTERLYAAVVLVVTQIVHCCHMFAVDPTPSILKLVVLKELVINMFACNDLPILQLALTSFWSCLLRVDSKLIQFEQQQQLQNCSENGNDAVLSPNHHDLLVVILQNLSVHQEPFLCQQAAQCCLTLVKKSQAAALSFFASPWTEVVYNNTKASITHSKCDISAVILFQVFLGDGDNYVVGSTEELVSVSLDILQYAIKELETKSDVNKDNNSDNNTDANDDIDTGLLVACVTRYFQEFFDRYCNVLEYESLKRFKADLKAMDRLWKLKYGGAVGLSSSNATQTTARMKINDGPSAFFVEIFELYFTGMAFDFGGSGVGFDVTSSVTRLRKQIENRITEIDDDETESDDDG